VEPVVNFSGRDVFSNDDDAVIQIVREWIRRQPQAFFFRASGCFQNVGKNVLAPEGSTLKTDMCKEVFGNYGFQKTISPGHI
jgi:hypothetical protein